MADAFVASTASVTSRRVGARNTSTGRGRRIEPMSSAARPTSTLRGDAGSRMNPARSASAAMAACTDARSRSPQALTAGREGYGSRAVGLRSGAAATMPAAAAAGSGSRSSAVPISTACAPQAPAWATSAAEDIPLSATTVAPASAA